MSAPLIKILYRDTVSSPYRRSLVKRREGGVSPGDNVMLGEKHAITIDGVHIAPIVPTEPLKEGKQMVHQRYTYFELRMLLG